MINRNSLWGRGIDQVDQNLTEFSFKMKNYIAKYKGKETKSNNYVRNIFKEFTLPQDHFVALASEHRMDQFLSEWCKIFHLFQRADDEKKFGVIIQTICPVDARSFDELIKEMIQIMIVPMSREIIPQAVEIVSKSGLRENMFKTLIERGTKNIPRLRIYDFVVPDFENEQEAEIAINNHERQKLKKVIYHHFIEQTKAITTERSQFKGLKLDDFKTMSLAEKRQHLRFNSTKPLIHEISQTAFTLSLHMMESANKAAKDKLWEKHRDYIKSPEIQKAWTVEFINDDDVQSIWQQNLFRDISGQQFEVTHPSPLLGIMSNQDGFHEKGVMELFPLNPRYITNLMKISYWTAQFVIRSNDSHIESDNAALLLEGVPGSGKTTIADAFQNELDGYKWQLKSNFQNPIIAFKSLTHISDCHLQHDLCSSHMVKVLGFSESVMVEAKNQHPFQATRNMPMVITTNNKIRDLLKQLGESVVGPLARRLFVVQFRDNFRESNRFPEHVESTFLSLDLTTAINRMRAMQIQDSKMLINTVMAMAIHMLEPTATVKLPAQLHSYFTHIHSQFKRTVFGNYFLQRINSNEWFKRFTDQIKIDNRITSPDYPQEIFAEEMGVELLQIQHELAATAGGDYIKFNQSYFPQVIKRCLFKSMFKPSDIPEFDQFISGSRCKSLSTWILECIQRVSFSDLFDQSSYLGSHYPSNNDEQLAMLRCQSEQKMIGKRNQRFEEERKSEAGPQSEIDVTEMIQTIQPKRLRPDDSQVSRTLMMEEALQTINEYQQQQLFNEQTIDFMREQQRIHQDYQDKPLPNTQL